MVAGQPVRSASQMVAPDADLTLAAQPKYASRGGLKLEAALDAFSINVAGRSCADVGASNGGFTDCLLQHGATSVIAIDVGYGQLEEKVRTDPRVTILDRTNVRHLVELPTPVTLVTIDVSFISLALVLPVVSGWLDDGGTVLAMVKPQFEVGKSRLGKGGVVRDASLRAEAVHTIASAATNCGLQPFGVCPSPITGPAGNHEYFLWLVRSGDVTAGDALKSTIDRSVAEDRPLLFAPTGADE